MLALFALIASLAASAAAQATSFKDETGVRSLWIPYQTVSGTPLASIASNNSAANVTVYVVSCPTESPSCAFAPNLTLTEGESMARYVSSFSSGAATLSCDLTGTTSAVCHGAQQYQGQIQTTESTLTGSDINYQAVKVTQTLNNTSTMPVTVTVTGAAKTTSSSSTSSSKAGVPTMSSGPWAMGGAIGAGLVALAAL